MEATKSHIVFFSSFQFGGQNNWMVSPPCFRPPPPASAIESLYRFHQLSVDCCVASSNGSHLRPRPHLSLNFLMGLAFVPQTRKQTAAPPNPMVCALHGPIAHREQQCHELLVPLPYSWREKRAKALEGRVSVLFCCCVLLCCVVGSRVEYCYVIRVLQGNGNIQKSCGHNIFICGN